MELVAHRTLRPLLTPPPEICRRTLSTSTEPAYKHQQVFRLRAFSVTAAKAHVEAKSCCTLSSLAHHMVIGPVICPKNEHLKAFRQNIQTYNKNLSGGLFPMAWLRAYLWLRPYPIHRVGSSLDWQSMSGCHMCPVSPSALFLHPKAYDLLTYRRNCQCAAQCSTNAVAKHVQSHTVKLLQP